MRNRLFSQHSDTTQAPRRQRVRLSGFRRRLQACSRARGTVAHPHGAPLLTKTGVLLITRPLIVNSLSTRARGVTFARLSFPLKRLFETSNLAHQNSDFTR